jgi:hypothetical protein
MVLTPAGSYVQQQSFAELATRVALNALERAVLLNAKRRENAGRVR